MIKSVLAGAMMVLAPLALHAQRGEDTIPRAHIFPALGLHVGSPQKASAALGVVLGEDWQKNGRDHSRNVALFAEPGLGAGRASLAYVDHGYGGGGARVGPPAPGGCHREKTRAAKKKAPHHAGGVHSS